MNTGGVMGHVKAEAVEPGDEVKLGDRAPWREVTARHRQRTTVLLRFSDGGSAVLRLDSPVPWRPAGVAIHDLGGESG